jgi:hypothetical protein
MDVSETAQKGWLVNCLEILYIPAYNLPGKLTNARNGGEVNRLCQIMYDMV